MIFQMDAVSFRWRQPADQASPVPKLTDGLIHSLKNKDRTQSQNT